MTEKTPSNTQLMADADILSIISSASVSAHLAHPGQAVTDEQIADEVSRVVRLAAPNSIVHQRLGKVYAATGNIESIRQTGPQTLLHWDIDTATNRLILSFLGKPSEYRQDGKDANTSARFDSAESEEYKAIYAELTSSGQSVLGARLNLTIAKEYPRKGKDKGFTRILSIEFERDAQGNLVRDPQYQAGTPQARPGGGMYLSTLGKGSLFFSLSEDQQRQWLAANPGAVPTA